MGEGKVKKEHRYLLPIDPQSGKGGKRGIMLIFLRKREEG